MGRTHAASAPHRGFVGTPAALCVSGVGCQLFPRAGRYLSGRESLATAIRPRTAASEPLPWSLKQLSRSRTRYHVERTYPCFHGGNVAGVHQIGIPPPVSVVLLAAGRIAVDDSVLGHHSRVSFVLALKVFRGLYVECECRQGNRGLIVRMEMRWNT